MPLLPTENAEATRQMEYFLELRQAVVDEAFQLFDERGKDHDVDEPFWHRYPFGDVSYAQMCFETAGRLVSVVQKGLRGRAVEAGKIEDRLLDLINWAVMWLAWRKMQDMSMLVVAARKGEALHG